MNDPIEQVARWVNDAGGPECTGAVAMCLATVGEDDRPAARMVLLRGIDDRRLRFFTSYGSRKARDLDLHPSAAAVLFWPQLSRQVRIEGSVAPLAEDESDEYFAAAVRAATSWRHGHPSRAHRSKAPELLAEHSRILRARFECETVPRPHGWGGYLLPPILRVLARPAEPHARPHRLRA